MKFAHKTTMLRSLGWLMVAGVVVLSLVRLPATPTAFSGSDKLLHLGTYFFLSLWFFHVYHNKKWQTIAGFVLLGTMLEWLQSLTSYRYMEWLDWAMNLAGVALAWLVFFVMKLRLKALLRSSPVAKAN